MRATSAPTWSSRPWRRTRRRGPAPAASSAERAALFRARGVAALLFAVFTGCSAAPPPPDTTAERLGAALATGARDDFLAGFATGLQAEGESWYTVLTAGDATVTGPQPGRLRVRYRLPGDRATATEELGYTLTEAGISAVDPGAARPVWSFPAVEVSTTPAGTLVSAGLTASTRQRWTQRLAEASAVVRAERLPGGWSGGLVVLVPPEGRFAQATGETAAASAITTCTAGTARIVVNPAVLGQPEDWLDATIVHEAVHVATDTACGPPAAAWVVEGLAESAAARFDPDTAAQNRELVRDHVGAHGLPDALPRRMETLTDYALAQVAVDAVRARLGERADGFWRRALLGDGLSADEVSDATRWYRSEVRERAR